MFLQYYKPDFCHVNKQDEMSDTDMNQPIPQNMKRSHLILTDVYYPSPAKNDVTSYQRI